MEHYEDYPWCPYSDHSGGDTDDEHRHDTHLAKVRTRSISRSRNRNSFLVDELDMLMDKAAATIQAAWRGYLVRKRVWTEHKAASTIQAAWRRFITREYRALQREQPPSWQVGAPRPAASSPASSVEARPAGSRLEVRREEAATVIQAHYRGYVTRRVLSQCNQAATTIQAQWRGYRTRQDLARGLTRRTYPSSIPSRIYYSGPRPVVGAPATLGPYPRKHWRKCLVGTPEEWRSKVPRCPKESEHMEQVPQAKSCPKCGRCTTVRVLEGVGKGPPFESEDSEFEGSSRPPLASYRARRRSPGPRLGPRQKSHTCGVHVSYQVGAQSSAEDQPRRQGREPGGLSQRYSSHVAARPSKERVTSRSLSSTSVHQQGPPAPGTSDWLYENYCAHRMGEGQQRRVFKTRKHMWELAQAATCIQAFWRGWKARQALRLQEKAAVRIQAAYRGYKTRVYLIDAGILSEGDYTD
ncbi:hypothetical protein lerEdw1_014349 [Lerista edwardsae]|nr:hypothetical protein lerEdw1_014349 [Lerista edwardsae]